MKRVPRPPCPVYALELAGEDDRFAAAECAAAATDVTVVAPGLATARGLVQDRFRGLAYGRTASALVARTDADVTAARTALEAARIDRSGSVAVAARDVRGSAGVSTQAAERALGEVLVERGFAVDLEAPDHQLRALFAGDTCLLGWRVAEAARTFADRAPTDKPFFVPGSMDPRLARACANLALVDRVPTEATVVDPMCGTGGGLVEAGLLGADVVGLDAQRRMVEGAASNLRRYLDGDGTDGLPAPGAWSVCLADAARLPLADDAADAAVFDVPYGRQSRIEGAGTDELTAAALEAVEPAVRRAVVVADRSLVDAATAAGWTVSERFERPVHRSLVRHVHVLA